MEHVEQESIPVSFSFYLQSQEEEREVPMNMNPSIMIEPLISDKDSEAKESEAQEEDQYQDNEDDEEEMQQMIIRPEYSRQRIQEIAPKLSAIMYSGSNGQKSFDKIEANLFEKIFNSIKKVRWLSLKPIEVQVWWHHQGPQSLLGGK